MGKNAENVNEALARTLHDHGIHMALDAFLKDHDGRRCVGLMGGHAMLRTEPMYEAIVMLSKRLTEEGFYMLTGGGPGAMEATHLGAWMAGRTRQDVEEALTMLAVAPSFKDPGWLSSAFGVLRRFSQSKYVSLGVPTWLYGHEPSTPFTTHIAKFFENSIREDNSLTLAFESLDSRSVPVNVTLAGTDSKLWYTKNRINPQQLTISGAASVVQRISSASVTVDVTDRKENYTTAAPYVLYDSEGEEIPQAMLDCSASSITVGINIYPTRELAVSNNVEDVLTGQPAEGYVIESITMQPETVIVAADQELLDSLDVLLVEPIDVEGASQSFSRRVALSPLADIKYTSAEQVYVTVQIAEETSSTRLDNVELAFIGQDDTLALTWHREAFSVRATGPKSRIEALENQRVVATVDLSGLKAGSYGVPLVFPEEEYPDITFEPEPATVRVTLEARDAEE